MPEPERTNQVSTPRRLVTSPKEHLHTEPDQQRVIPSPSTRTRERSPDIWRLFTGGSILIALLGGFLLGALLFILRATDAAPGRWQLAAVQAHGHVQLFGWAGLMVFGVALHFLPRLLGQALWRPDLARYGLFVFGAGLALRLICQPLLLVVDAAPVSSMLRLGLGISGLLELLGVTGFLLPLLVSQLGGNGPGKREGGRALLPFFGLAAIALWLAAGLGALGVLRVAGADVALMPARLNNLTQGLMFYGFLLPVALAMSARTFPLYLQTIPPSVPRLTSALTLLASGLVLRELGLLIASDGLRGAGQLLLAGALAYASLTLGVFGTRRPLPRRETRLRSDPLQCAVISAYIWLLVAAVLLISDSVRVLLLDRPGLTRDLEQHLLGLGFVTLLIFGVGGHLLPGFGRRRLRSGGIAWAVFVLGNLAVVLRVAPVLLDTELPGRVESIALALAGPAALLAVALFGYNVLFGPAQGARRAGTGH